MNTITNPTIEQIERFCELIKESLISAYNRGSIIELGMMQITKTLTSPEYGKAPVDIIYAGARFKASFDERI